MATKAAILFGGPTPNQPLALDGTAGSSRAAAREEARDGWDALLGWIVAAVVTGLLLLGLGALVVAEYALVWHLVFAPWLGSIPAVRGW
jgi:hypothetical protein